MLLNYKTKDLASKLFNYECKKLFKAEICYSRIQNLTHSISNHNLI